MFKTIAIVVVVLLVVGVPLSCSMAATKPDTFRVERAASIKASPEKIFTLLNDLHRYGPGRPTRSSTPR